MANLMALENAGIKIIQIDEPAIREGLPLRKKERAAYPGWAVKAFRISASGVRDETQIHTHNTTNHYDTLFGGTAMHLMDEVAFITATRFARKKIGK